MGNPAKDLTGNIYGILTVLRKTGSKNKKAVWLCQCACGNLVERQSQSLRSKHRVRGTKSCGCLHGEWSKTHGMADSRPYIIWRNMIHRCQNEKDKDYRNYGGRGITVCQNWVSSFDSFWKDMQATYSEKLTLDRVNNELGYSKENCRWATMKQQCRNTRKAITVWTPDGDMNLTSAAEKFGIKTVTLHARIFRYKWPKEKWYKKTYTTS